jgi:branched-subunit amino acid transport protein
VVVPAGALKTDGQNSLLESKQLNKKMCSIIQVIPIPRLQAILVHTIFGQHPSNDETKTATPNNILATEITVLQIELKISAMLMLIQQLQ